MHKSGYRTKLPLDADFESDRSNQLGHVYRNAKKVLNGAVHPLVWIHPPSGRKALMASPMWLSHLEGTGRNFSHDESQVSLARWLASGKATEYSHEWVKGDFIVWDNRWLYHTATPNNELPKEGTRLLHRIRLHGQDLPDSPLGKVSYLKGS